LDEVHALNAMGRGGLNLNPGAYRELRQQKLKGKGKGGKAPFLLLYNQNISEPLRPL
jgi:hypothetical protein